MLPYHLNNNDIINLGSYYTPLGIVNIVFNILKKHVDIKDYILLDSSCGYGSFLYIQDVKHKIGIDIDTIEYIKLEEPNTTLLCKDFLMDVNRNNYGIKNNDKLIIIGNPPYNDRTSLVKRNIKINTSKHKNNERDIGISFLKSFIKLYPDYVCVLHPLSYLIKKHNFNRLKSFYSEYELLDHVIISSEIFCKKSINYFPIIIALYKKGKGMDYNYVKDIEFITIDNKHFKLNDYDYISNYINKYPNDRNNVNNFKAMFYTLRDINALRRNSTFIKKINKSTVYVSKEKYSLYCYVDVFKKFIKYIPYYFGNLDIIINYNNFKLIENDFVIASESNVINLSIIDYFKSLFQEHFLL